MNAFIIRQAQRQTSRGWLYSVRMGSANPVTIGTRLDAATAWAKRHGATNIKRMF